MDAATHGKIVDLRKRISGLLDRDDFHLSANVGIQYVWRKQNHRYRKSGKIYGECFTVRFNGPGGMKINSVTRPESSLRFTESAYHRMKRKEWANCGVLLASFKLPIEGFDDNRFCDISVFEVEAKGRGPVFSDSETQKRFAAHAHPIDDTLPKEFDEIFNEVAAVQHPLGRFGSNKREMLLAQLAERVQKRGELVVEENSEDGKPQTLSHVAYIMAYREFDYLLGDMLNESRFGGDVSTQNVTPNPPLARRKKTENKRGRPPATADKIKEACKVWIEYQKSEKSQQAFCDWWNGDKEVARGGLKWLQAKLALVRKLKKANKVPEEFENKLLELRRGKRPTN